MLRPLIDILMTVVLLLSMSYELFGNSLEKTLSILNINFDSVLYSRIAHEYLGFFMILLFFYHLYLNKFWLKNILRGRYNLTRAILTITNIILILLVLVLTVSGFMMSSVIEYFNTDNYMSLARESHITASYWGYVIMSFHAGLNWHIFNAMLIKHKFSFKRFSGVVFMLIAVYGAFAFFKRNFWDYMSMNSIFVFFDYEEAYSLFILDYISIMILFAVLGHCVFLTLKKLKV